MSDVATLQRFGSGTQVYEFPATVTKWRANFANLVTQTDPLPGLPGGFDQFGVSASPSIVGLVEVTFWLLVRTEEEMTAQKDALLAIANWGKQTLWVQPYNLLKNPRWANARVKSIDMPEDADGCTNLQQECRVVFEVPEARWYSFPTGVSPYLWGANDAIWDATGVIWGGSAGVAFTGPGPQSFNISDPGSAPAPTIVKLTCGAAQVMTNPTVKRIVNGLTVESIQFLGVVGNNQVLILDTTRLQAKLNSMDVYDDIVILTSSWLTVQPGANLFTVESLLGTDACTVKIDYNEAYF